MRRLMHETLAELGEGLQELADGAPVELRSVELSLPLDLRWQGDLEGLVADLPLFRMRTDFDPPITNLRVTYAPVPS